MVWQIFLVLNYKQRKLKIANDGQSQVRPTTITAPGERSYKRA